MNKTCKCCGSKIRLTAAEEQERKQFYRDKWHRRNWLPLSESDAKSFAKDKEYNSAMELMYGSGWNGPYKLTSKE